MAGKYKDNERDHRWLPYNLFPGRFDSEENTQAQDHFQSQWWPDHKYNFTLQKTNKWEEAQGINERK